MARFVVDLVYGEDEERRLEVRPAHREYCRELAGSGVLLAAGPFTDNLGAQVIYEVADADELQKIIDADPYAEAGVLAKTTIREWNPVIGAWL
jgi:uncharacterized protein